MLQSDLPSCTVSFLFMDVEGSTQLWEHHPKEMRVALDLHNSIMRTAIEDHSGLLYETAGDSFLVVFSYAPDAVAMAVAAQSELQRAEWPEPIGPVVTLLANPNSNGS